MTLSPLPLTNDPSDHALGLIYRDAAPAPRTHALIVGVGSYPWSDLPELSSPPASARAIADWFLGFGDTRFQNDAKPLGSLIPKAIENDLWFRSLIFTKSLISH